MTTPRIQTLASGITKEMIAVQTHMFYEPSTGGAVVAFQAQPCLYQNEVFMSVAGDYEVLQRDLAVLASECLGQGVDPVTGADLTKISGAGMVLILKAAFASLWDAQVASEQPLTQGD